MFRSSLVCWHAAAAAVRKHDRRTDVGYCYCIKNIHRNSDKKLFNAITITHMMEGVNGTSFGDKKTFTGILKVKLEHMKVSRRELDKGWDNVHEIVSFFEDFFSRIQ